MDRPIQTNASRPALPTDLPDETDSEPAEAQGTDSLAADVEALVADIKTYLEAELAFQKSRAAFTADRLKATALYGAAALGFVHLALIALTLGLVIALATLVGPWLATVLVVGSLLIGAGVFVAKLRTKLGDIRDVFENEQP